MNATVMFSMDRSVERLQESTGGMVATALKRLETWVEEEGFQGWDPHDGLNSPLLGWLGKRNRFAGIALVQLVRRIPLNLRPLLRIHKGFNPKAMGLFLAAYAERFSSTGDETSRDRAEFFARWLAVHAATGYAGSCWGYNFDWPNRGFSAPAGTPTIVNTACIGLAFLAARAALKEPANLFPAPTGESASAGPQDLDGLAMARSACEFILRDLHKLRPDGEEICFSYTPIDHRYVHNANLLGAWLLAAVYAHTREGRLAEGARAAARFTARRQESDGSWPYGIARRDAWVDNFHTGYVLVALKRIASCLNTNEFAAALQAGYDFWKTRMFLSDVIPKYYPHRTYPIDIHSVAQAILTFLEFADVDPEALSRASRICHWAIENLQDRRGFFHYQIRRRYRVRIPYMRWGQCWMLLAMTKLACHRRAVSCEDTVPVGR